MYLKLSVSEVWGFLVAVRDNMNQGSWVLSGRYRRYSDVRVVTYLNGSSTLIDNVEMFVT